MESTLKYLVVEMCYTNTFALPCPAHVKRFPQISYDLILLRYDHGRGGFQHDSSRHEGDRAGENSDDYGEVNTTVAPHLLNQ